VDIALTSVVLGPTDENGTEKRGRMPANEGNAGWAELSSAQRQRKEESSSKWES